MPNYNVSYVRAVFIPVDYQTPLNRLSSVFLTVIKSDRVITYDKTPTGFLSQCCCQVTSADAVEHS